MKTPDSLVFRLTRTLTLAVAIVWLLCVAGLIWWVDKTINHNFDDELVEISHRMLDIAVSDLDRQSAANPQQKKLVATPPLIQSDAVIFHLLDAQGNTLLQSAEAPEKGFGVTLEEGFSNSGAWRVFTVKHPGKALFLQLADPLEERSTAIKEALVGLVIPMIAILPILALLVAGLARRELSTVSLLEEQIARRGGADLRPISLDGLPAELQQVGANVNRMLERLTLALDTEKALAASAAHELRTPLATIRLNLEAALENGLSEKDVKAAIAAVMTVTHRTEKLLQMSRAESGATLGMGSVDLIALAGTVIDEFWRARDDDNRIDLTVENASILRARGDMDALAIALRNLVENALRHGGEGRVQVRIEAPCTLSVTDFGPALLPDALHMLQTADPSKARKSMGPGTGLGVSIVRAIVTAHRAKLEFHSPARNGVQGLEALIILEPQAPS